MISSMRRGIFAVIRFFVKLFYPKITLVGLENLPQEPCVVVANHTQMNGPIIGELYFPGERRIWCAGEMMHLKEVPPYAYRDFWSRKPKAIRWFYKLLSYVIAPLSVCVFNSAHTIPVYRGSKVLVTFRESIKALKNGANIVIFPEHDVPHNHIVCGFQEGFVDLARSYHKQTGKVLAFAPMYLAPALRQAVIGQPVYYDPNQPMQEQRGRICDELMARITALAVALPEHTVVPYNNMPKNQYVSNKQEAIDGEKAGG